MRKTKLILLLCLLVVSCGNSFESENQIQDSNVKTGSIYLSVLGPEMSMSNGERAVLNTAAAYRKSDTYEIFVYNSTQFLTAVITQNTSSLSVPVGTYNIVLLAGQGEGTSAFLYGSSYKENVIVEQDTRTNVTLTILPIKSEIIAPDEVVASRDFTVKFSGDTRNPFLRPTSVAGATAYYMRYNDSQILGRWSIENPSSVFSVETILTAPSVAVTYSIELSVLHMVLHDDNYNLDIDLPNKDNVHYDWIWIDNYYWNEENVSKKTINIIEDPTGIGVTAQWGE